MKYIFLIATSIIHVAIPLLMLIGYEEAAFGLMIQAAAIGCSVGFLKASFLLRSLLPSASYFYFWAATKSEPSHLLEAILVIVLGSSIFSCLVLQLSALAIAPSTSRTTSKQLMLTVFSSAIFLVIWRIPIHGLYFGEPSQIFRMLVPPFIFSTSSILGILPVLFRSYFYKVSASCTTVFGLAVLPAIYPLLSIWVNPGPVSSFITSYLLHFTVAISCGVTYFVISQRFEYVVCIDCKCSVEE